MKKIKIVIMVLISLCILSNIALAETMVDVNIEPDEPVAASQITITAVISSENNVEEVYLEIQECKDDLCFQKENVSMNMVNNNYQKQYQLKKDKATYFKYSIAVLFEDGSWYNQSEKTDVPLKPASNNGGTDGEDGENKDSPGFELILIIIAISLTILFIRRKRLR